MVGHHYNHSEHNSNNKKRIKPIKSLLKPLKRYANVSCLHRLVTRGLSNSQIGAFVSAPAAHWLVVGRNFEAQAAPRQAHPRCVPRATGSNHSRHCAPSGCFAPSHAASSPIWPRVSPLGCRPPELLLLPVLVLVLILILVL